MSIERIVIDNKETHRETQVYIDCTLIDKMIMEKGVPLQEYGKCEGYHDKKGFQYPKCQECKDNTEHDVNPMTDVANGSWVMITRTIPVQEKSKPIKFGIYWAVPSDDKFKRVSCKIRTDEDVVLLEHEYSVVSEERLEEYKANGWELHTVTNPVLGSPSLNMELLQKGRALVEEERDIIRALQLDGLTEYQACEMYYLSRHTDDSNYTICYIPIPEVMEQVVAMFGSWEDRIGRFTPQQVEKRRATR